jgi:prophage DNA circulation protein
MTVLEVAAIVGLVIGLGIGIAGLVEWRLRAHLGAAREIVTALRAHVDSFDATWDSLEGKIKKVSARVEVLSQGHESLAGMVEGHYQALRRAKIL